MKNKIKYRLIIDTDSYSGNFEREITAYVFGLLGESEVGEEYVEFYKKETGDAEGDKYYEIIEMVYDDHGGNFCEIVQTDNTNETNSIMFHFNSMPTKNDIKLIKSRIYKFNSIRKKIDKMYNKDDIKILSIKLYKEELKLVEISI